MLIRKNTKAFKTILEIVTACQSRPDREKLIRVFITKAGHSVKDRINVEGIEDQGKLFYEMTFQNVLNYLNSSSHQLHVSDEVPGIYFFHSTSNKVWEEAPFEFDEAIKEEFSSLDELPAARKKGKAEKFVIPTTPKPKTGAPQSEKKKAETPKTTRTYKAPVKSTKQPDFKLKHEIEFTDLEKVIFRQAQLNKHGVLEYYNKIAEYILPHLKDRPLWSRRDTETLKPPVEMCSTESSQSVEEDLPSWIKTQPFSEGKQKKDLLLCNDKEHLLFYVEMGNIGFDHGLSKARNPDTSDYVIIIIDSPNFEITKAIDVALAAKEILDGLQLPSFIKTDGMSGLHVYIPLESKSDFATSNSIAEYLCKLIRIKIPDLTTIAGESDEHVYGKVSLDYSRNESGKNIIAPYSLVPGQRATVATPLLWNEVKEDLHFEDFNHETILKRLKQTGDPFENLSRKKVNGDDLLERLDANYSFLF